MAFFDFFWKRAKQLADTSAQNTVRGISEQLEGTSGYFAELAERLRRIETKQKETSLQLDEIDNFLQSGGTENALVDALVALSDTIGDFYYYAGQEDQGEAIPADSVEQPVTDESSGENEGAFARPDDSPEGDEDESSPLLEQARMMWNAAKNALETAGLEVIDAANEPFDFRFHSAESAEQDNNLPNGYVIRTLKYGYIYKEEVMRRALVVVNKVDAVNKIYNISGINIVNNADDVYRQPYPDDGTEAEPEASAPEIIPFNPGKIDANKIDANKIDDE